MRPRDVVELIALAAIWGASFLFMRVAVPEFGPAALAFVRGAVAAAALLPVLAWRGQLKPALPHWRPLLVVGLTGSALPFLLFNVAALAINGGAMSIFNATTPLWGAAIAARWWRERLDGARIAGLALGFAGVVVLAADHAGLRAGEAPISPLTAVLACLLAPVLYGFTATYTKKYLGKVPALAQAGGSQLAAALWLAPLGAVWWPAAAPGPLPWAAALALALLCSALAYLLYFRLIAHAGPTNAMSVTFLIPAFAVFWGWWLLDETITVPMLIGCAGVFVGTALVTGLLSPRRSEGALR
jgi:drug/metabolite transporter (DMT)-like permease